jgi:hypothetical protein
MFISVKRLMIAATATAALSAPSVAYAAISRPDASAGSSASGQAQRLTAPSLLNAERQLRLGQLRAAVARPFASQGDSSTTASRVHATGPSLTAPSLLTAERRLRLGQLRAAVARPFASQGGSSTTASRVDATGPSSNDGFRWDDAGIGAAGMLTVVVIGFSATLLIRRRTQRPLAS